MNNTTVIVQFSEPYGLKVFRLAIFTLVVLASLLGNSIVLKAVFETSTRKALTHYLVANLAVAEMIVTVLNVFLQVYTELRYFPFGEEMCRLLNPTQTLTHVAITNTLATIALHRYRVFSRNYSRKRMATKQIALLILFLWIMSLAIVLPSYISSQLVRSTIHPNQYWCVDLFPGDTMADFPSSAIKRFYMAKFILNFIIPVIVMSASYGFVGVKLRHHRNRSIRDIERDSSDNRLETTQQQNNSSQQPTPIHGIHNNGLAPSPNHGIDNNELAPSPQGLEVQENSPPRPSRPALGIRRRMQSKKRKGFIELERDLLKMFYAIIIVFIVFYFPYQVFFILEYFGILHWTTWRYFDITRDYIYLLTHFPSALHPICYGTMSQFFARTFSRFVLCKP